MAVSKRKGALAAETEPPRSPGRTHYISPKLARLIRPETGGYGVYATQAIGKGELLVVWGGHVVAAAELEELATVQRRHSIQVEEDLYLVPHDLPEVGDFVNHSCSPNAGLSGQMALVAIRNVAEGEELCYDYAMSDGSPYDEFACSCGAEACRGRVTGNDWALPNLQERYAGYFSPYLQRRIDEARAPSPAVIRGGLGLKPMRLR